jgi:hypothetical protein
MSLLESDWGAAGAPNGVVLTLVGPDLDEGAHHDQPRSIRMYNLSSLVGLAQWSIAQEVVSHLLVCRIRLMVPNPGSSTTEFKRAEQRESSI